MRDVPNHPPIGRPVVSGLLVLGLGIGGFAAWAGLAPLSSAALAPGQVQIESNRKTVQHQDGGIVAAILVREGDRVAAGQVLLRLDDVETRAERDRLADRLAALRAHQARLLAEIADAERLSLPPEVSDSAAAATQRRIFASRRALLERQTEVLGQTIAQHAALIAATCEQIAGGREQLALIDDELADARALLAQGLARKPRVLALEREAVRLRSEQGRLKGQIAQAQEAIAAARLRIAELYDARLDEAASELEEVRRQRAETAEQLRAAEARQQRRDLVAPVSGTVLDLRYFGPGAVVPPGGQVLDIVPEGEPLSITARVSPLDIDSVHAGLPAQVVLSAYKTRTLPRLEGTVQTVSADALTDETTSAPYFEARVTVPEAQLAALDNVTLTPGMPAEVLIVTGERTVAQYLLQPLRDSLRRAFREE